MVTAPTLDTFLTSAKQALRKAVKNKERVLLVLGNEEADLDSCVSALLFAYLRTASPPKGAFSNIYIPLINTERSSIAGDELLARVLPHASVSEDQFITVDDLVQHGKTHSGLTEENTRFFLVNQNVMLGREEQDYSRNVAGCIDNHVDQNYVPMQTNPEPRIIGKAGSCTSLVVNWGISTWEGLDAAEGNSSEEHMAKLALATILVNTRNLEDGSVVTDEDVRAVDFLESRIKASNSSFSRVAFYSDITGKRLRRPAGPRQASSRQPFFVDTSPVAQVQPRAQTIAPASPVFSEAAPVVETAETVHPDPVAQTSSTVNTLPVTTTTYTTDSSATIETLPVAGTSRSIDTLPTTPPSYTYVSRPISTYVPRYLADILAEGYYGPTIEGKHQIGVSQSSSSLAQLVSQAERDLVNRAIAEASSGHTTTTTGADSTRTTRVKEGTPFTASVREFTEERGLSLFAIATEGDHGKELFLWALSPDLKTFVPSFTQQHDGDLGLSKWGEDDDIIVKEAGVSEGTMQAFWMKGGSLGGLPQLLAQGVAELR